jgi:hypothetical protein
MEFLLLGASGVVGHPGKERLNWIEKVLPFQKRDYASHRWLTPPKGRWTQVSKNCRTLLVQITNQAA